MPCPPGTGCAHRADCQDGHCPGRTARLITATGLRRVDLTAERFTHPAGGFWHKPTDTASAASDTPTPSRGLVGAVDALLSSPTAWLVLAVICIACAVGLGLLAGVVSELGPDRVWAVLTGGSR